MSLFSIRIPDRFDNRLTRLLGPVIVIVLMLVLMASVSVSIMSSLRAFVSGESLWSKAQKDAVGHLRHYVERGDAISYQSFLASLAIPAGDHDARLALDESTPDLAVARAGFLAGGNHPDDISGMIWLYRNFKNAPHVAQAVRFWIDGDALILQLRGVGERALAARDAADFTFVRKQALVDEIDRIDVALTPIEAGFSNQLGEASRLTAQVLSVAIFSVGAGLLLMLGTFFGRLMAQSDRSQRELALSEERLRLGFQGTNCGLWDWNIVTNEVFYSPWIHKLLEYGDGSISTMDDSFIEMVHPDDRATTVAAGKAHIVDRVPYDIQYRIRTMTGNYLWVRSRAEAVRDANGRAVRMAGSIFDISHLKEIESRVFIERELAQVTLAAIADAVIRTDLEGHIDYCNAAAEGLLGQAFDQLRGQTMEAACNVFDDATRGLRVDIVGPVLSERTSLYENANLYLVRADRSVVAVDASSACVRDQGGNSFGAVVILHDVSAEREHALQMSHQASHDALTGLVNRREFERQLSALLALPAAARARHAIMYLDLDQLKIVNDSGGHAAGDQLIRQLSALLLQRLRDGDLLARIGGDEFGVILRSCGPEDAAQVAESLRKMIFETGFFWQNKSYPTGLSIGLITDIDQFDSLNELMRVADAACFMAKEKGRNRVHRYRTDDQELSLRHREIEWVARIGEALEQNRFRLYAQRIVPIGADQSDRQHIELLLRMVDGDGQLIPPMTFIPAAERYNLMPKVDRWVIGAAFGMLAESFGNGVDPGKVTCSINISGASIEDEHFLDFILEQQRRHGIPFSSICFEITETAAIANLPIAAAFIARLRSFGCYFSLDDFGAGMSSFGYLKHLPVDFLKIDGSFVKDMVTNPIDHAMVEAINQIGHVMGKQTIAEFVENDAILDVLRRIGVDFAQGYGIGKPEPFHPGFLFDLATTQSPDGQQPSAKLTAAA
jgi:diguanylate cyclase (GGDEF)-like protein/PAS domain S-box-containing protein